MLELSGSVKYANENCQQLWHFFGVLSVLLYFSCKLGFKFVAVP